MTAYILDLENGSRLTLKDTMVPTHPSLTIYDPNYLSGCGFTTISRDEMVELHQIIGSYLEDTKDQ